MSKSKKKQLKQQEVAAAQSAAEAGSSTLPTWARLALGAFIAGITLVLVVGTVAVYLLADLQKRMFDPTEISATWDTIVPQHDPLPKGFAFLKCLPLSQFPSVDIAEASIQQGYTWMKMPKKESIKLDELLQQQLDLTKPHSRMSNFKDVLKGNEIVGGEQMSYVVRQFEHSAKPDGQQLTGVMLPKDADYSIALIVSNPNQVNMEETRKLLATIKGFGNVRSSNSSSAPKGNSPNNAH